MKYFGWSSLCQLSLGKIGINFIHVQLEGEKKLRSKVSASVFWEQANSKFRKYHVGVVSKKYQACLWTLFTSVLVLTQTAPKPFQQPRIRTLFTSIWCIKWTVVALCKALNSSHSCQLGAELLGSVYISCWFVVLIYWVNHDFCYL